MGKVNPNTVNVERGDGLGFNITQKDLWLFKKKKKEKKERKTHHTWLKQHTTALMIGESERRVM